MTTEEHIAELQKMANKALGDAGTVIPERATAMAVAGVICELRALRLMLREEIREAAWRENTATAQFHQ